MGHTYSQTIFPFECEVWVKEKKEPVSEMKPAPHFSRICPALNFFQVFFTGISERTLALGLGQSSGYGGECLLDSVGTGAGEEPTTVLGLTGKTVGVVTQEDELRALQNRVGRYIETDGEDGNTFISTVIGAGAALGCFRTTGTACWYAVCEEDDGMLTGRTTFAQYVHVVDSRVDEHAIGCGHGFAAIGVVYGASVFKTVSGSVVVEGRPGSGDAAADGGSLATTGDG